jgi:hypothetical protein
MPISMSINLWQRETHKKCSLIENGNNQVFKRLQLKTGNVSNVYIRKDIDIEYAVTL